jgi:hypothetical protein
VLLPSQHLHFQRHMLLCNVSPRILFSYFDGQSW